MTKLKTDGVMFGDDYGLASVSEAVKTALPKLKARGLGVNSSQEQTWYTEKTLKNLKFLKISTGQNTLKK